MPAGARNGGSRKTFAVPETHAGRLFDHVHLRVADLDSSRRFYAALAEALGLGELRGGDGWFSLDELFVSDDGPPTFNLHIAFQAVDREAVHRFHDAALAAGGRDNGSPGERAYHPGYYRGVRPRSGRQQRRGGVSRTGRAIDSIRGPSLVEQAQQAQLELLRLD